MAPITAIVGQLKRAAIVPIVVAAIVLLVVWGLESPPGLLGKADAIGYAVCHRIDLRSFHIGIRQLPLCARCTGQYVGAMIGLLFQAFTARRRSGFPSRKVLVVLGLLVIAYGVDGLNSYLYLPPFLKLFPSLPHLYVPTNTLRLFTGSGMGVVIAALLYPALLGSLFVHPDSRPAIRGLAGLFLLLGLAGLADLLILTGSTFALYPAAWISSAGVIILLTFAYTIVILRIYKKENHLTRWSELLLPMALGFLVTMSQIALTDLFRFIITGTWAGIRFG